MPEERVRKAVFVAERLRLGIVAAERELRREAEVDGGRRRGVVDAPAAADHDENRHGVDPVHDPPPPWIGIGRIAPPHDGTSSPALRRIACARGSLRKAAKFGVLGLSTLCVSAPQYVTGS